MSAHEELEKRVAHFIAKRQHISRNVAQTSDDQRTFGERLADRIASFGGSWTFLISFALVLVACRMPHPSPRPLDFARGDRLCGLRAHRPLHGSPGA